MPPECPKCVFDPNSRSRTVRFGSYFRTSDRQTIQRFRCLSCQKTFSAALFSTGYRQKKRTLNGEVLKLLGSNVTQRRAAWLLGVHRRTLIRKFLYMSLEARFTWKSANQAARPAKIIEFDDLETFESTKCKPLSVTLAVEYATRRILGVEVSRMPAKGLLVERAKKYGFRKDERAGGRARLFESLKDLVAPDALIKSDHNPHYPKDVARYFPEARHVRYEGRKSSLGGQGELKKTKFDPLFTLNHTCAMLRANVSRLIRKTWNTTKCPERLEAHLVLYASLHNSHFIQPRLSTGK